MRYKMSRWSEDFWILHLKIKTRLVDFKYKIPKLFAYIYLFILFLREQ